MTGLTDMREAFSTLCTECERWGLDVTGWRLRILSDTDDGIFRVVNGDESEVMDLTTDPVEAVRRLKGMTDIVRESMADRPST